MSNPFETPMAETAAVGGGGDFDLSLAFRQGWDAMSRNLGVWIVMMVVAGFCGLLSVVACLLPALLVIPVISWGTTRFTLDALDGQAELGTVFSGFNRVSEVWAPMFTAALLFLLAMLPGIGVSMLFQFAPLLLPDQEDLGVQMIVLGSTVIGSLFNRVWDVVVLSRLAPAMYLVVDKQLPALDAFNESWRLTSTCWGKSMVFTLAAMFVPFIGLLACCVGIIPASVLVAAAQASMYRQLVGPKAA
jgi:uncharacterized membrane protein